MKYDMSVLEILTSVGHRLKAHRLQQNISTADLAARAGLSRLTVVKAEAGKNSTLATVVRILRALGRLDALESFLPTPTVSPLALLAAGTVRPRIRAHRRHKPESRRG